MAVAKANVGIGGRRADGRGFRIEGAEAKVGGGRRRIGQKREQTLLKAVSWEIADSGLENILR